MRPSEAPRGDWNLYYDNTWMMHRERGPTYIRVGPRPNLYTPDDMQGAIELNPEDLDLWWPRGGSYNGAGTAFYIGRRSRRSMKKSASNDHYFVVWGRRGGLREIAQGYNFLSFEAAREVLDKNVIDAAALSRDIIIQKTPDNAVYLLIYRGIDAGTLHQRQFFPHLDGTPAAKRARIKLRKEDLIE